MIRKGKRQQFDLTIPTHFVCKISACIMDDPVITSNGQMFERESIQQYFDNLKEQEPKAQELSDYEEDDYFKCPVTRMSVDPDILIPNKRMKRAIEDFVDKNPWAFEYDPYKGYKDIVVWEAQS